MDYAAARRKMVENQLRANKVTDDRLLEAMGALPREAFVPKAQQGIAYVDEDLQIAPGRFLLEPMILARLLQAADVGAGDVVLAVADAGGYAAAVLSRLAGVVVVLEADGAQSARTEANLRAQGIGNTSVVTGRHGAGHQSQAPYNVILINGAVEVLPDALLAQLAEGGRLVTVQADQGVGHAILIKKVAGNLSKRVLFDAGTPLLADFAKTPGFVF